MENSIFREKSVQNISSPDELNDYIRVVSPPVWITLVAIILLLVGVTAWGVLGHLDTTIQAVAVSDEGTCKVYFDSAGIKEVIGHNTVMINDREYVFDATDITTQKFTSENDNAILAALGMEEDSKVSSFEIEADLPEGFYAAGIVINSVKPMSFVTN